MKKRLSTILAMLLAISVLLSACGGGETQEEAAVAESSEQQEDPVRAYFVTIVSGGVAWGAAEVGFNDACSELGWDGQFCAPTTANDQQQVINLLETAVTDEADVIIACISDKEMASDVLSRAREQGIAVITTNTKVGEELSDAWIGTDPVGMGQAQASVVLEEAEKKGLENITLAYIQTRLSSTTQNEQYATMCAEIKKVYPDAQFVQDECNSNAQVASDKVAAYLAAYPELNVIVSMDGYGSPGIANYIEGENLQDKLIAIGVDDSPEILDFVESGALNCTIAQDFYKMGNEACFLAQKVLNGEEIDYDNDSGTIIIYPEDCAEHLELLKERGLAE